MQTVQIQSIIIIINEVNVITGLIFVIREKCFLKNKFSIVKKFCYVERG
jgi:hypothetical protein